MSNFYGNLANSISDDGSEISEVDPEEMAKMGDVDDLDADLFGSPKIKAALTSRKKSLIKSAMKTTSDEVGMKSKPKVTFEKGFDFDEADPLGDLLSDDDESLLNKKPKNVTNDKFKESLSTLDRGDSATNSPNKSNINLKSKDISALFGLGDEEKSILSKNPAAASAGLSTTESSSDWLGLTSREDPVAKSSEVKVETTAPKRTTAPRKRHSITFDDDDILSSMGFDDGQKNAKSDDVKSVPEGPARNSVLGIVNETSTLGATQVVGRDDKHVTKELSGGYTPSMSREPRRNFKRVASGITDPLGIFSTPTETKTVSTSDSKPDDNPQLRSTTLELKGTPADQLNPRALVPASNITAPASLFKPLKHEEVPNKSMGQRGDAIESVISNAQPSFFTSLARQEIATSSLPAWLGGTGPVKPAQDKSLSSAVTRDSPVHAESQLPVVGSSGVVLDHAVGNSGIGMDLTIGALLEQQSLAALDRQETQLQSAVQLQRHEERLAALQNRQHAAFARQEQQLQFLLDQQAERQKRLDQQVAAQTERISGHIRALAAQSVVLATEWEGTRPEGREVEPGGREQLEVVQREVEGLRLTLEELKRKHREEVVALEESYKRQLEIHKAERANLEEGYQSRITRMEVEFAATCDQHKVKLATLREERLADLQQLRDVHRETIADLKAHQATMMDHLSLSLASDSTTRQQAGTLDTVLGQITRQAQDLAQTQSMLGVQQEALGDAREAEIKVLRVQLEALRKAMAQQREWSDGERDKLLSLVTSLEGQLNSERARCEEERWGLKQEAAKVEGKLQASERVRERWQEQAERERQEIKSQREATLQDLRAESARLEEQKLQLAAEKATLATLSRLQGDASHKIEAEMEAALRAANKAQRDAENERARLVGERGVVAKERGRLHEMERDLIKKAREMEKMTQMAVETREDGLRALEQASQRDHQQTDLAASIETQLADLKERKRRNVEESMRLSQERQRLSKEKTCSFCRNTFDPFRNEVPTSDKAIVDPKLVLLKLQMNEGSYDHNLDTFTFTSQMSASK